MIKIRDLKLGGLPRVAISVDDRGGVKLTRSLPVDILEIRVDQFKILDPEYVAVVIKGIKKTGSPLILTIRSKNEGGQKNVPDRLKIEIFKRTISLVDAIDIELKSPIMPEVVKMAKKNKKLIIVSWNNFKLTPKDKILRGILSDAKKKGAQLVKIAARANSIKDVKRLMEFTADNKAKNMITISLGPLGSISRFLFPMAGSLITYAYVNKPSGPGQMPLKELRRRLRIYSPLYIGSK